MSIELFDTIKAHFELLDDDDYDGGFDLTLPYDKFIKKFPAPKVGIIYKIQRPRRDDKIEEMKFTLTELKYIKNGKIMEAEFFNR